MLQNHEHVEIVSGGAPGADKLGELYAEQKDYEIWLIKADEANHGSAASYLQNIAMVEYSDALIVFYNWADDRDILHLVNVARSKNLKVKICEY